MRNLFTFLWKYYFVFLLLFFEIISAYLIVENNYYQKASYINSTNKITASLIKTFNNVSGYFSLKKTNEQLAEENAILYSKLEQSFIITDKSISTVNDTIYKQQYQYLNTRVIKNSINKRNNYLMLDKGKIHGIQKDMGVISSNGILGIIKDVSNNFSSVISVLHKNTRVNAKIKKNNFMGTVLWNGRNYTKGTLIDIPAHVKISKGDTIVTSGNSLIFPEGVLIGTVLSYKINKGDNFYTISLKYAVDYDNVSFAYVVNNLMKNEQTKLQESFEDE